MENLEKWNLKFCQIGKKTNEFNFSSVYSISLIETGHTD